MSMRIHKLTTYMHAEEACSVIEFLDQVREVLLQAYGDDITAMLQQATTRHERGPRDLLDDEEPF